jgi:hypothetical protein
MPWVVWAAAAVVVLSFGTWFFLDQRPDSSIVAVMPSTATKTEGPAQQAPLKTVEAVAKPVPPATAEPKSVVPAPTTAKITPPLTPSPVKEPPKPVIASVPKPPVAVPEKPATHPSAPAVKPEPPKSVEKDPVTIRKALLPTPEELEKMKQGHVQRKVGVLPEHNTASPLPPSRN